MVLEGCIGKIFFYVINEIVIVKKKVLGVLDIKVYVGYMFFNIYKGDGFIIVMFLGLIVYNLSVYGLIVYVLS